jgi:hypothetical protein
MLKVLKNAHKSEMYAYLLLRDSLLKNKSVVVGDDIPNGLPDIHTLDNSIGIEVTCAEEPHIYRVLGYLNGMLTKNSFDYVNNKFIFPKNLKMYVPYKDKKYKYSIEAAYDSMSKEGILHEVSAVIYSKLCKLNGAINYKGVEKVYLFVVSDYVTKSHVTIEDYKKIYDDYSKDFETKFDGFFVTLNNELHYIDKVGNINLFMPNFRKKKIQTDYYLDEQRIKLIV